jgi:hypothetical protein
LPPNHIMDIVRGNSSVFKPGLGTSWYKPVDPIAIPIN